jgi:hypothetical protein
MGPELKDIGFKWALLLLNGPWGFSFYKMKDLYLYSEKAQYKMLFSHIIILL